MRNRFSMEAGAHLEFKVSSSTFLTSQTSVTTSLHQAEVLFLSSSLIHLTIICLNVSSIYITTNIRVTKISFQFFFASNSLKFALKHLRNIFSFLNFKCINPWFLLTIFTSNTKIQQTLHLRVVDDTCS